MLNRWSLSKSETQSQKIKKMKKIEKKKENQSNN